MIYEKVRCGRWGVWGVEMGAEMVKSNCWRASRVFIDVDAIVEAVVDVAIQHLLL